MNAAKRLVRKPTENHSVKVSVPLLVARYVQIAIKINNTLIPNAGNL